VNTSLGINFYRTVNEEGSNGWAQVYARIPFDDYELSGKGALFGVVLGKPMENWAGLEAEVMEWVDEYFNKIEEAGDLGLFAKCIKEKYPEIEGSWLWIVPKKDGRREIKSVRWGVAGVSLSREGREYNLALEEGKVVRGMAEPKDSLVMWSGKLGEILETNEEKSFDEEKVMSYGHILAESREAAAGLFFDFDRQSIVEEEVNEEIEIIKPPVEEIAEMPMVHNETMSIGEAEDLAGEELVGPVGTKDRLQNWWKKIRPLRGQDLRVDPEGVQKRKKWAVLLGVLFLILLSVSLVTGSLKIKADREAKKWREFSDPITKNIQEASDLVKINPSGARKLVEDVRKVFDIQKAEFVNGKYKNDLGVLEQKLNDAWTVTSGEKESQIEEMVNIQLVRPGFVGERMSLIKAGSVLVVDGKLGTVISAVTATKDIKVVAGKGEGLGWLDASGDGSRVLILNSKGVSVNGTETGGITFDLAVSKAIAVGRFGASLYVLDSGNKEIYKYGAISNGFGDRVRWLSQDQSMSLMPVDMAIDSDIWVLGESGSVERFRRGAREQFVLNGVPEGTKTSKLAVQLDGNGLAMLDNVNGTVIVCSKETGNCEQILKSEKLKLASDIEFDGSNLLVLVSGTIGVLK
jgi:hypothetical protein